MYIYVIGEMVKNQFKISKIEVGDMVKIFSLTTTHENEIIHERRNIVNELSGLNMVTIRKQLSYNLASNIRGLCVKVKIGAG